jgi:copper chaperone CopZ
MCYNCKTKIEDSLKENGYNNFAIDMGTSLLTFENDVNEKEVVKAVNKIGYRIIPIEDVSNDNTRLTEEEIYGNLFDSEK